MRRDLLGVVGRVFIGAFGRDRHDARPRVLDPGVEPESDAPRLHPRQCIIGQARAQFGQDALPRMDYDHAQIVRRQARVIRQHPSREIIERTGQFRAGKTAPQR